MQLNIKISEEYADKIIVLSEQMGLKKTEVVRLALKQFVDENLENTPYQKVKHLIGSVESGIEDLGENHRKYLKEKFRKSI